MKNMINRSLSSEKKKEYMFSKLGKTEQTGKTLRGTTIRKDPKCPTVLQLFTLFILQDG